MRSESAQNSLSRPASTLQTTSAPAGQERLYVLDCVRLVAMLMMMQGHTIDALLSREFIALDQFPWTSWEYIRGLTAPVFLLVSGAVHVFATRRDARGCIPRLLLQRRIRWAVTLIGIGYLMTFPTKNFIDIFFIPASGFFEFWQINILQLSGVTMIMLMLFFVLTRNNRTLSAVSLVCGLAIIAATPFVHAIDWYDNVPAVMANYLTFERGSIFPIFPFAAYLFLGVPLGRFLQRLPSDGRNPRFAMAMFIAGFALVLAVAGLQMLEISLWPAHDYWHSGPGFMMERLGYSLVFIGVVACLYQLSSGLKQHYALLGSKALHIYVGHLILLYGTPWYEGYAKTHFHSLDLLESVLAALLVIGLCIGTVYIYDNWKRERTVLWSVVRYTAVAALAYAMIF